MTGVGVTVDKRFFRFFVRRSGVGVDADTRPRPGLALSARTATKRLPKFRENGGHCFNTDQRDFVAVFSRQPCTNS